MTEPDLCVDLAVRVWKYEEAALNQEKIYNEIVDLELKRARYLRLAYEQDDEDAQWCYEKAAKIQKKIDKLRAKQS